MKSASKIIASLLIHCAILALINLKETSFVVSVYLPTKDFNQVLFEKRRSLEFGEIPLANPCMFVSKSVSQQSRKREVEAEQMQKCNLCEKSRQSALAAMSRPAHNTVYQVDGTSKPLIKNRSNFGPFEVDKRDLEKVQLSRVILSLILLNLDSLVLERLKYFNFMNFNLFSSLSSFFCFPYKYFFNSISLSSKIV